MMVCEDKKWLKPKEVAELFDVSYVHIYSKIKSGEIPHVKIGSVIRIPASWVDEISASVTPHA